MVIWRIPEPVQGSSHHYKYRLFYGRGGKRIVGYDNERPKGDHRHIEGQGEHVQFNTLDTLIEEFWRRLKRGRKYENGNDQDSERYKCGFARGCTTVQASLENRPATGCVFHFFHC